MCALPQRLRRVCRCACLDITSKPARILRGSRANAFPRRRQPHPRRGVVLKAARAQPPPHSPLRARIAGGLAPRPPRIERRLASGQPHPTRRVVPGAGSGERVDSICKGTAAGGWFPPPPPPPRRSPSLRLAPDPARGEATDLRRRDGYGIAPLLARRQPEAALRVVPGEHAGTRCEHARTFGSGSGWVRGQGGCEGHVCWGQGESARTSAPGTRPN